MSKTMAREGSRIKTGRASRSLGQSWQVPIFLFGLLIFGLVAASAPLRRDAEAYEFTCDVQRLRDGLTQPEVELDALQFLAESLIIRQAKYPTYSGEVEYLVGTLFQRRGESTPNRAEEHYSQAIKHLQRSLVMGPPGDDEAGLLFQLGQAYYETGDLPQAIEHTQRALTKGYERRAAAYGLLVQSYLRLPEPNLESALATNQKQLLEFTDEDSLAGARLARGQILIAKGDHEEAFKTLDRINSHAPRAILSEARFLQTQCCEKEGWWEKAISLWQDLLEDPSKVPGGKARIQYALGLAHRHGGPNGVREAEKAWAEAIKAGGEIGQAAGIRLGELRLLTNKTDASAALKVWSQALMGMRTPKDYQNKLVDLAEARQMFERAFHVLAEGGDFQNAQELAILYQRLAVPGESEEKLAEATEALARKIVETATGPGADSERLKARPLFERAALAYEQAAKLLPYERQGKAYWRGAKCHLQAEDHPRAAPLLEHFVKLSTAPAERAEAFLALGQTYQALRDRDKARQAFIECIGIPNTSFAYEARYQIAEEYLQLGNHDQAVAVLNQSLSGVIAPVDGAMHEKSLYKLAEVHFIHKNYEQAHFHLKNAIAQYPNNPEAISARDRLGECSRKLAENARERAKSAISKDSTEAHEASRRQWLLESFKTYEQLAADLARQPTQSAEHEKLLRKAEFTAADLQFEVPDMLEALRRYQALQVKHRRQFAGLVACLRIWQCIVLMLNVPEQRVLAQEAGRDALRVADEDLRSMPPEHEAFHDRPGGWVRTDWQNWVNAQRRLLDSNSPPAANP